MGKQKNILFKVLFLGLLFIATLQVSAGVSRYFVIQPIEVCANDGTNCQNVSEASYNFARTTYETIDIGAVFLEAKQFNSSAFLSYSEGTSTTFSGNTHIGPISEAAGNQASSTATHHNMWLVNELVMPFPYVLYGEAGRYNHATANSTVSVLNAGAITSANRIDTLAHELGHNLGLDHTSGNSPNNLMESGSVRNSPATLFTAGETARAQGGSTIITGEAPEIEIHGNGVLIADNDTTASTIDDTDFGSTTTGVAVTKTYTIKEVGNGHDLYVSGATVSNTTDFTISTPSKDVVKGSSTTFTVQCSSATAGVKTATVTVKNNDPDDQEFVYDYAVKCTVANPLAEIAVLGAGNPVVDGTTTTATTNDTDFGTTAFGTAISKTFAITEVDSIDTLVLSSITISDTTNFALTTTPTSVAAGGSSNLVVQCKATASGTHNATITIANNDPDDGENPYTFAIQCIVSPAPAEIAVLGNSNAVIDGTLSVATTNDTDFGTTAFGTAVSKTFAITEVDGDTALTLSSIAISDTTNFALTTVPTGVTAGGSSNLVVQCKATASGTHNATVTIANNDPDDSENPYTFAIQCIVSPAPAEIAVLGNSNPVVDGTTTTATINDTDFGTTAFETAVSKTFAITEVDGDTALTLSSITISDTTNFALTTVPTGVTAGGSSNLVVQCKATDSGTHNATITIANNDPDDSENPYSFAVKCIVSAAPAEIAVLGNGNAVVDGTTTTATTNDTDFGTTAFGTAVSKTFAITEVDGDTALTLSSIAISDTTNFALTTVPTGVTAGGSSNLVVQCKATASGTHNATITIVNNDADDSENPYTFAIQCIVSPAPAEIAVLGNSNPVVDGTTTTATTNDTDFGTTAFGTAVSKTFAITEVDGDTALTLSSIAISDTTNFALTTVPTGVTAGGSSNLVVQCKATDSGTHNATITIVNNDADDSENPYTFAIQCIVSPAPAEIAVLGNSNPVVDGTTTTATTNNTDFGTTGVSTTVSKTFAITEVDGDTALTLSSISISDTTNFALTSTPTSVVAGGSSNLVVQCKALAVGTYTATVTIANNDPDDSEDSYTFAIRCVVVTVPAEIAVLGNSNAVVDGTTTVASTNDTDFGTTAFGAAVSKTFAITEVDGVTALTLSSIAISDTTNFALTTVPTGVTAGGSSNLVVQCKATASGTHNATVTIANNDPDDSEDSYTFAIRCTVSAAPAEIAVLGNSNPVVDGTTTTATTNDTDFGTTAFGTAVSKTFAITEVDGDTALSLSSIIISDTTNFALTTSPTSVAAGGSSNLVVQCKATASGTHNATVTIANNDPDDSEDSYTFAIRCTVSTAPAEIAVLGNSNPVVDGTTSVATTNNTDFGSTALGTAMSKTFAITEVDGDTALTLSSITISDAINFTLTTTPTSVAASGTSNLVIQCNGVASGTFTATVTINNNDLDDSENPYTFAIKCIVNAAFAEIAVLGNSNAVVDGATTVATTNNTDFGTTAFGTAVSKTFAITEVDNGSALTLPSITISDTTNFALTTVPTTVAAGSSSNLVVQCKATASGTHTATVTINNNDPDDSENPYTFAVKCIVGTAPAEIAVTGNGSAVVDGSATVATANNTDFGFRPLYGSLSKTFVISEVDGDTALTLSSIAISDTTNFAITSSPTNVAAGGSANLVVKCVAGVPGTHTAIVTIVNNDPDDGENPYTFTLKCEVSTTASDPNRDRSVIAHVLASRARNIIDNEPELANRRISRQSNSSPLNFALQGRLDSDNVRVNMSTSLSKVEGFKEAEIEAQYMSLSPRLRKLLQYRPRIRSKRNFDVWVKANWSKQKNGNSSSDMGILYVGVESAIDADRSIGFIAQLDRSYLDDSTLGYSGEGQGWMIGPYITGKAAENLYYDVRLAIGRSDNELAATLGQQDTFESDRLLVNARVTGEYDLNWLVLEPELRLTHYKETQESYTNSLSALIPETEVSVTRLEFGPILRRDSKTESGARIQQRIGLIGIWENTSSNFSNYTAGFTDIKNKGLRARLQGSLRVEMKDESLLQIEGYLDGLGQSDYSAHGINVKFRKPF